MQFYCIGGGFWKPVSLAQCNTSPSHRVDQVVDCGLWNVGPLLFNGCVKLLDIGRNWNTLSYTPIQSIPNMLNGWHVRWVCWPCNNWDVFSFQELCTDPCNMGLWIIMLQHEVMVMDEWHNNGPQELITVSLCIQNAINKMHLCTITPPPPWATRSTTLTSANRSPTQRHTRCLPSACTVKTGIHPRIEHLSKVPDAIECEHWPTQVGYDDELQSGRDPDEDDKHTDDLPWDGFWQFVQKFFGYGNRLLQQLSGWLSQTIFGGGKILDVEVLGWCGYTWSAVVRLVWMYCQILWNACGYCLWLRNEHSIYGISSSGHSCRPLKTCDICGIVLCDKTTF